MLNDTKNELFEAIKEFIGGSLFEDWYPLGGMTPIPLDSEVALLHSFEMLVPVSPASVQKVRTYLDTDRAYKIVAFSLRMAVYAARTDSISALRASTLGLMIDDDRVDSRDILTGLSIVEDCAHRLNTDIASAIKDTISVATERRRHVIVEDFLARAPAWRSLDIMRISVSGSGSTLTYRPRAW